MRRTRAAFLVGLCVGIASAQDATTQPKADQAAAQNPPPAPADKVMRLSLEDALSIALQNDIGLKIEDVATDVAKFTYVGSWGAFDPVLTANASVTDSQFEATNVFQSGGGALVINDNTQEFSTGISFPLVTGGQLGLTFDTTNDKSNSKAQLDETSTTDLITLSYKQPLLRGAWSSYATATQREDELLWSKQREHQRQARQELLVKVENTYWDLVAAIEQLKVADTTLALGREQLSQNQRRLDAGVGTEVDVLQAEANVAVRVQERLQAEVTVRSAADKLKASLFAGGDAKRWEIELEPITPLPEDVSGAAPPWEAALAVALEQRPEIRQQRLEITRSEVELARTGSLRDPQLDLTLSSTSRGFDANSSDAFSSASQWEFPSNQAALSFSIPIGNRAASNSERIARARLRSAHLSADQLELTITTDVRDAVRQIAYQAEAVRAATSSLGLARRQLEAEEARYREGLSTTFQVLQFQQQLAQALSAEKQARVAYVKAQAALRKAQGLTGETERR